MLHALPTPRSILFVAALAVFTALPSPALRGDDAASPKKSTSGKAAADKPAAPAKDTVEGTLTINGTSYKLSHVAIYESKFFDEVQVTVLVSSKPLPLGKLKSSLKEDGSDDHMFLFEPHVKLSFNAEGELASIFAWADNNNINKSGGDDLKGEFVNEDGRITGTASLKSEEDSTIKCDYDLKFSGNLISLPKTEDKPESDSETTTSDEPSSDKGTVEGTLKINDVSVKLSHVVIYESKFSDEVRISVLASSKPIPIEELTDSLKKDGTDDDLTLFEPHVKLTFDEEGKLSFFSSYADGTSIARSGGDNLNGKIEVKDGRVTGSASHKSKADDFFKSSYDLKFSGNPLKAPKSEDKPKSGSGKSTKKKSSSLLDFLGGSKPKSSAGKPSAKDDEGEEEEMKEEEGEDDDDEKPKKKKSSDKSFNVYELPLPKDAKNVEYKKIVNMVSYKSATSVEDLADFIVKGLKKQGWPSEDDTDLITPGSCIISREKGDAEVTIFVKPDGEGSTVTIMSEGLSWEKKAAEEKSAPSKKSSPKADDDSEESEKEE